MLTRALRWMTTVELILLSLCTGGLRAEESTAPKTYPARDSLQAGKDSSDDAQACLEGLVWQPEDFTITVEKLKPDDTASYVRFPSAVPSGNATNDRVALEWYAPLDDEGKPKKAPAVVVVHESGARMEVGRLFARAIYAKGFHAFLIHLPYYGLRRPQDLDQSDGKRFVPVMRQAVSDVRRARDAVAALPDIDSRIIAIQGTSLGGFVTATTIGLDRGFDRAFIMLAGGDLLGVINGGQREAAQLRKRLAEAGVEGELLKSLVSTVEPTRLAHRVDPQKTWLYTAMDDQVVPFSSAQAYERAAGLTKDHHIQMWGDHYKVIIYFPAIVEHVVGQLQVE